MRGMGWQVMRVLIGLAVVGATSAHAEDWPQWRGLNRDGKVEGFVAPKEWPAELTQGWKVTVGTGDATPALVDGKLYVFARQGSEETVVCLNASDGSEVWRDGYEAQAVTGPAARHPGPRSSPAVAQGKVVTLGAGGVVSCLDAATGAVTWRNEEFAGSVPRFFTAASPIIVDGMAVVHVGGPGNGALVAFDLATGDPKWRWNGAGPAYASPVLMEVDGAVQLVLQTENSLAGVGMADGALLWQVDAPTQRRAHNSVTPVVTGQTVIYSGQGAGTRAVVIRKEADGFAVAELWTNPALGSTYCTPVLKDGLLFGLSDRGNLYCMRAETGETAWTDETRRENFGSVLDVGSAIVALSSDSRLVVFAPNGESYEELAAYDVSDQGVFAHPVLEGSSIFVKDSETLAMLRAE